jgi:hypothetical protein
MKKRQDVTGGFLQVLRLIASKEGFCKDKKKRDMAR